MHSWIMKRRNADVDKRRRPIKTKKSADSYQSSLFTCAKFLAVWGLILLADFILEFRFEYLYPVWLLLRSVQDSFKYQGLAFSVFFVCLALMADVVCYLFIPAQWLFFVASSYVWVQYVWHTERGICLSTVALWLLFVYVEAALRMRDLKNLPFNLDLCRPFAAHCIGYPVVTLGFGAKSYVSYKMRLRLQKDVVKNNEFYMDLLRSSLPPEQQQQQRAVTENPSAGTADRKSGGGADGGASGDGGAAVMGKTADVVRDDECAVSELTEEPVVSNGNAGRGEGAKVIEDYEDSDGSENSSLRRRNINDLDEVAAQNLVNDSKSRASAPPRCPSAKSNSPKDSVAGTGVTARDRKGRQNGSVAAQPVAPVPGCATSNGDVHTKPDVIIRLESDVKRLKSDLQVSRNTEQELRSQLSSLAVDDKLQKSELVQLRQDNDSLQTKLQNLVSSRQTDKQTLAALERRLTEERRAKSAAESQLAIEKKARKAAEDAAAARTAAAVAPRTGATTPQSTAGSECTSEHCRSRAEKADAELRHLRWELKMKEDQIRPADREMQALRLKFKDVQAENEAIRERMATAEDRVQHLEDSLSAETRLKLELFSALNDCSRAAEAQAHLLSQKDAEIGGLRSHIAEALSLVPQSTYGDMSGDSGHGLYTTPKLGSPTMRSHSASILSPTLHCCSSLMAAAVAADMAAAAADMAAGVASTTASLMSSPLNPNAIDYMPMSNH